MGKDTTKTFSTMIPADLGFSALSRKMSTALFEQLGLGDKEIFHLVLVIDELFMNAVKYGSDESSSVHLDFSFIAGELLTVVIEDEGKGDKCCASELKGKMALEFQHHSPDKTSGRGLAQIALNLTDSFEIEDSQYGGIKITFTKSLKV